MQPLSYNHAGARIAFYLVLGAFVVLEQRIRLRSWRELTKRLLDHLARRRIGDHVRSKRQCTYVDRRRRLIAP